LSVTDPHEAPIFIGELEIAAPITGISLPVRQDARPYKGIRLLVRMLHVPIGYVLLRPDALAPSMICEQVWRQLSSDINAQRARSGLAPVAEVPVEGLQIQATVAEEALIGEAPQRPLITVVICTRERPDSVIVALRAVAATRYRPIEVVVVDNAPSSDATMNAVLAEFDDDPRFRYVREPRPGLSCARNRGVAEATGEIIAFTDDDVIVDPWWLDGIIRGFQALPGVGCVTGLIATAEIENVAQLYFHLRAGWGMLCERRIFDLTEHRDNSALYPYSAGIFGAGANFAVSRRVFKEVGRFDEALGAGTPSGGGEDLNMFVRVILGGYRLVYEPSAIVSHVHRTSVRELSKQMFAYGTGCTAALTALAWANPRARRELPTKIGSGLLRMLTLTNRVRGNPTLPAGLIRREVSGLVAGPWLYMRGRRHLRRLSA
jgi:GT2 family glycosyltransferase